MRLVSIIIALCLTSCSSLSDKDFGYHDLSLNKYKIPFEEINRKVDIILDNNKDITATYIYRDFHFAGCAANFKLEDNNDSYRVLGDFKSGEFIVNLSNKRYSDYTITSNLNDKVYLHLDREENKRKHYIKLRMNLSGFLVYEFKDEIEGLIEVQDNNLARTNLSIDKQLDLLNTK